MRQLKEAVRAVILSLYAASFILPVGATAANESIENSTRPPASQGQLGPPVKRVPPLFPDRCLRGRKASFETYVELEFDVMSDGSVENISIVETSDKCFNDAAIEAVSQWEYDPLIIDGVPGISANEKTQITFRYDNGVSNNSRYVPVQAGNPTLVFASQKPSKFPVECIKDRKKSFEAHVDLEFDITTRGRVENIRALEASDECFIEAATKAVSKWKYEPPSIDGEAGEITNEKIRVIYKLPGVRAKSPTLNRKVAQKLSAILKKMNASDNEGALEDLDRLLAEERDNLKPFDLATTLELRGSVKGNLHDWDGAVADFEDAIATGALSEERVASAQKYIEQIKAIQAEEKGGARQ